MSLISTQKSDQFAKTATTIKTYAAYQNRVVEHVAQDREHWNAKDPLPVPLVHSLP
jgi:hypothetical protein